MGGKPTISVEELGKLAVAGVQLQKTTCNDSDGCFGDSDSCGETSCDSVG